MVLIHRIRLPHTAELFQITGLVKRVALTVRSFPPQTAEHVQPSVWVQVIVGVFSTAFIPKLLDTN